MIQIKYISFLKTTLYSYYNYLNLLFLNLNIIKKTYKFISSPILKKKKTILKSPHVNKKAKENYNLKLYSFNLIFNFDHNLLKQLKYNLPKNIHIKIFYKI